MVKKDNNRRSNNIYVINQEVIINSTNNIIGKVDYVYVINPDNTLMLGIQN